MTKLDLVKKLALENDFESQAAASRTVEFIIDTIKSELLEGNSVDISGLGKFAAKMQKGKSGTIPGTTKTYSTSDKMVPHFKAAAPFKACIALGKS